MNDNLCTTITVEELLENLQLFQRYTRVNTHPRYPDLHYTPGVRYLCEQANAYPFFDKIAAFLYSVYFAQMFQFNREKFSRQRWIMNLLKDNTATVFGSTPDCVHPFYTGSLFHIDAPLTRLNIWARFDGKFWTLFLPDEH